jgi:hypothetical protein
MIDHWANKSPATSRMTPTIQLAGLGLRRSRPRRASREGETTRSRNGMSIRKRTPAGSKAMRRAASLCSFLAHFAY